VKEKLSDRVVYIYVYINYMMAVWEGRRKEEEKSETEMSP
jgi:hypothetical protein